MRKLVSEKNASFDITKSREEESDSKNVKGTQDVHGKPQKRDEKPRFEQERIILALFSFVLYGKRGNRCTIRMFFPKRETFFQPHYLINFLLSSQKIYLGSYPESLATCSSYNMMNMVKYKDRCQVFIFLFWTLQQLRYYLVTGGERVRNISTVACGQVTWPLLGEKLLGNERDIRSTIGNTHVPKVVQHALNQ